MDVLVDNNRVDTPAPGVESLDHFLRHLQGHLQSTGRLMVALRCDDQEVAAERMSAVLKQPASSFGKIEISTSTRGELVCDTMAHAVTSLTETEAECDRIADCLTEGKTAEAMEALGKCMTVWQQIHDGMAKSISILGIDARTIEVNERPMVEILSGPKEVLLQIKQALECQDHVLLADTLKYEMADVMQGWYAAFTTIRRHARAGAPDGADP